MILHVIIIWYYMILYDIIWYYMLLHINMVENIFYNLHSQSMLINQPKGSLVWVLKRYKRIQTQGCSQPLQPVSTRYSKSFGWPHALAAFLSTASTPFIRRSCPSLAMQWLGGGGCQSDAGTIWVLNDQNHHVGQGTRSPWSIWVY